jgi:hypothetical protein
MGLSISVFACDINSNLPAVDKLVANSVTIASGADITLTDSGARTLALGTAFTVIDNTAAIPIAGVFRNLPDGSTIPAGRNTFQAN